MADIKIKQINKNGDYSEETTVEITGADYIHEELIKSIIGRAERPAAPECKAADGDKSTTEPEATESIDEAGLCRLRRVRGGCIYPALLKQHKAEGQLDEIISPFDEIDIPLDTGGTVTAVCACVEPDWGRFVLKDCWDEAVMNEENTNKTGYFKSKGRAHVLVDILPHIAKEWREIFKPRQMVEEINGERVEYADLMWLLSATDVFGPSEDGYWKDLDDSFQLPIFKRERDRVKELGDNGTYPYWLRSVHAANSNFFGLVLTDGSGSLNFASYSHGFAPGFDI